MEKHTEVKEIGNTTAVIESWKCQPGDEVVFVFKPWIKFEHGKCFHGVVVARNLKTVHIKTTGSISKVVIVPVNCVRVVKMVPRLLQLKKKFQTKPIQLTAGKKKELVTKEVLGLKFTYKKQC